MHREASEASLPACILYNNSGQINFLTTCFEKMSLARLKESVMVIIIESVGSISRDGPGTPIYMYVIHYKMPCL